MPETTRQQPQPSVGAGEYLEKSLRWSEQVRRSVRTELDVPYGVAERQKLDIYLPEGNFTEPLPVFMFLHGGYWVIGHKDIVGFMAPPIIAAPAIFAAVGYRMAPESKYPDQVDDCRNALGWLHRNIARHGGDPERIFVGGHSAGGHLAALIALQTERLEDFGRLAAAPRTAATPSHQRRTFIRPARCTTWWATPRPFCWKSARTTSPTCGRTMLPCWTPCDPRVER